MTFSSSTRVYITSRFRRSHCRRASPFILGYCRAIRIVQLAVPPLQSLSPSSYVDRCCQQVIIVVIIMNAESQGNRVMNSVGSKGRMESRSRRCFYCGIPGHGKKECRVRIYCLERAKKRKDEKNILPDIEAMDVDRQRKWEEVFMSFGRLLEDLKVGSSDEMND